MILVELQFDKVWLLKFEYQMWKYKFEWISVSLVAAHLKICDNVHQSQDMIGANTTITFKLESL